MGRYLGLKFVSQSWFNLDATWASSLILVGALSLVIELGELGLSLQRQYPSEVLATDPHGQASGFGSLAQTGFWLCWSDGTDAINASETDCVAGHVGLELGNPCASHVSEIAAP